MDAIVKLRENGNTLAQIATSLGICRTTVKKYLVRSRKKEIDK
ncbi:helix-turn-helix domain-containing protein [Rhizobium ruizarguesonis]